MVVSYYKEWSIVEQRWSLSLRKQKLSQSMIDRHIQKGSIVERFIKEEIPLPLLPLLCSFQK